MGNIVETTGFSCIATAFCVHLRTKGATGLRLFFVHQLHHRRAKQHQVLRESRSSPDLSVVSVK
jgi:hypothetical protein